ncbi:MEDS domain-containing protein [Blastococcus litoris]|uniref:MEDS domain-containing protein n=1 Tax=Blastococcus litoris TaxID=2171622 RepID=UPI0013E06B1B|nr:MEDS domain-containing protein [Blastococcus litoris]
MTEVPRAGASDHICWVYDEDDEAFDRAVRRFLAGGLERRERVLVIGNRVIDSIGIQDDGFGDAAALAADGTLRTLTTAEAYEAAGSFLPGTQRTFYDDATREALADGYTGLRVVADVSPLAEDPVRRAALVEWEHVADEFIAQGPGFTAMCAYSSRLTPDALSDLASVHPLVHAPTAAPPFRVFFDGPRIALSGSIDTFSADRLTRVLASSPVDGSPAVLDLSGVDFVDVAASRAIARWARDLAGRRRSLEVRGASPLVRRMWRVLGLADLAPVTFSAAG